MHWVLMIWSMIVAACLTMAGMHVLVWIKERRAWSNLLFALAALGTAGMAAAEYAMMQATTPAQMGVALRWLHVPAWVVILALVGFVRTYLHAGRPWLAWTIVGLRTLSLILNFYFFPNLNFREMGPSRQIEFLGESVAVAVGVSNPWMIVGQLSLLLLVAFMIDATWTAWRRGERRRAWFLGGSMCCFVVTGTAQAILVLWGVMNLPLIPSPFYLLILMAMGYELSADVLHAARLARALDESERRMALAAQSAHFGMWTMDFVRDEIWATDSWRAMFGMPVGEVLTRDRVLAAIHPEDRDRLTQAINEARGRGGDYECEYRVVRPEGQQYWISSRGSIEYGGDRKPLSMLGVSQDITRRKQAEREAEQHRRELAHLSRVTMLGELSGSLAHELNQPLGAIIANADAAELHLRATRPDLEEVRKILVDINKDGLRAGDIIHRMRAFLQRRELAMQPIDLERLAREAAHLAGADASARKVAIAFEVEPGLPFANGDAIQLQQVLLNLVINGMDAMADNPPEARRLVIQLRQRDARTLELMVRDAGCGISADVLGRVFDSFFSTKRNGLGLGLGICRSIVEAHGGDISLANNPDRGATARFTLPVAENVA